MCRRHPLKQHPRLNPPWGWESARTSRPPGLADLLGPLGLAALGSVVVADRGDRGVRARTDVLVGAGARR
eukprot:1739713-Alexandrium_andersonii.AAC.1